VFKKAEKMNGIVPGYEEENKNYIMFQEKTNKPLVDTEVLFDRDS